MRSIKPTIDIPDYAETGLLIFFGQSVREDDSDVFPGIPASERRAKGAGGAIVVHTPEEIEAMRVVCRMGREVLDMAGSMVKVGITTEEIDIAVHQACMDRNAYPSPLNYSYFPKCCCT